MRILTRYILQEVTSHAVLGVALFTFIIFMRDLGRLLELIVRNSAPLPSVTEIFLFTLPTTFTITLPMGVLVGILVGLSRMAADSEVTAMRASGLGVGMFIRVIAIFAVAGWLLGMVNSVYVAPRSAAALDHLQERLKSSQASFEIQPRVFYEEFKNIVLYVQDVVPAGGRSLWRGIFLADISNPASPKITLSQRGALLSDSPDKLRFHLEDGTQQEMVPRRRTNTPLPLLRVPRSRFKYRVAPTGRLVICFRSRSWVCATCSRTLRCNNRQPTRFAQPTQRLRARATCCSAITGSNFSAVSPFPLRAWCWRWSAFPSACLPAKVAKAPASCSLFCWCLCTTSFP